MTRVQAGVWRHATFAAPIAAKKSVGGEVEHSLTADEKYLALTLAVFMDADGSKCTLGTDRIRAATGLRKQTVIKGLKALRDKGYLWVEPGSGTRSNHYSATLPLGLEVTANAVKDSDLVTPSTSVAVPHAEPQAHTTAVPHREPQGSGDGSLAVPKTGLAVPESGLAVPHAEPNHPTTTPPLGGGGGGGDPQRPGRTPDGAPQALRKFTTADNRRLREFKTGNGLNDLKFDIEDPDVATAILTRIEAGWLPYDLAKRMREGWPRRVDNPTRFMVARLGKIPLEPDGPAAANAEEFNAARNRYEQARKEYDDLTELDWEYLSGNTIDILEAHLERHYLLKFDKHGIATFDQSSWTAEQFEKAAKIVESFLPAWRVTARVRERLLKLSDTEAEQAWERLRRDRVLTGGVVDPEQAEAANQILLAFEF